MSAAEDTPLSDAEADALFADLSTEPALVLAISGGPDSTALLVLAARWAKRRKRAPKLLAATVDHGLRPESRREAAAVKTLCGRLGVAHRTLRWRGPKPVSGLQAKARAARYALLGRAARQAGARVVLTAHTSDDQAETVLFRLARGSGLAGLAGMARARPLPASGAEGTILARPLLDVPKARLISTLAEAGIDFAEDSSNRDPRFTRVRLRALMPALAREGLTAERLVKFAGRMARADRAVEAAVDDAAARLAPGDWPERGPIVVDLEGFRKLPEEVALRLVGRAVDRVGDEGPVELGKLEALVGALQQAQGRFRRTLAGACVTLKGGQMAVERAPARRNRRPPKVLAKFSRPARKKPNAINRS